MRKSVIWYAPTIVGRNQKNWTNQGAGSGSGSTSPIPISQITNQWKMNETSGTMLDSIGGDDLAITGTVGRTGTNGSKINTSRSFIGTGYGSKVAGDTLACVGLDFSFSCWFLLSSVDPSPTRQIFLCRNAGSTDGNLHWILRTEAGILKLYIGNGVANAFASSQIAASVTQNVWHHFAMSFTKATQNVRWTYDGSAVTSTSFAGFAPATSGLKVGIGGEVAELWYGNIDCIKLGAGKIWTDAELIADWNSGNGWEL
jgi:hypothetical protein